MTKAEFKKHITGKTVYTRLKCAGSFNVNITKRTAMEFFDHCEGDITLWIHDGFVGVETDATQRMGMPGWIIWEQMP